MKPFNCEKKKKNIAQTHLKISTRYLCKSYTFDICVCEQDLA